MEKKDPTEVEIFDTLIARGLNVCAVRMPKTPQAAMAASPVLVENQPLTGVVDGVMGFVASPWDSTERRMIATNHWWRWTPRARRVKPRRQEPDPKMPADYEKAVDTLVRRLGERGGKTVLSVRREGHCDVPPLAIFERLCCLYPDAFVYCWHFTGTNDVWVGATPEVLLSTYGGNVSTMALAGTRPAGTLGAWDEKNIEEQGMVRNFILEVFRSAGLDPHTDETLTLPAGPVEHICTPIFASLPTPPAAATASPESAEAQAEAPRFSFTALAERLSPTPAVCGLPREAALADIRELEPHPRGYYAGYCGIVKSDVTLLFVTLRCAKIDLLSHRCWLYAGGGITAHSDPRSEWNEINAKMQTLASTLT